MDQQVLNRWSIEKKVTYLCVVRLLLESTTVLEGFFGEYHSSTAALGKQRLGVTKQPPFGDWGRAAAPNHQKVVAW